MAHEDVESNSVDPRLNSSSNRERLNYGLEIFRGLIGSERFAAILTGHFDYRLTQVGFVQATAKLVEQPDAKAEFSSNGDRAMFIPDSELEKKYHGRSATVYTPGVGVIGLTLTFPDNKDIITGGLVHNKVITDAEAQDLKTLTKGNTLLRLVAMDGTILDKNNLVPFVQATHSDEPNLVPKRWFNFLSGNRYEVSMYGGVVRVVRERGKVVETEEWVGVPPAEGEGVLLIGKKANTKAA